MAAQRLFAIPELLEKIISQLPMIEIVRNQRVSRQWRNTTTNSLLVQQALWLCPNTETPPYLIIDLKEHQVEVAASPCSQTGNHFPATYINIETQVRRGIVVNPLFFRQASGKSLLGQSFPHYSAHIRPLDRLFAIDPQHSIAKAYITSPPVQEIRVSWYNDYEEGEEMRLDAGHHASSSIMIRNDDGVKVKDVVRRLNDGEVTMRRLDRPQYMYIWASVVVSDRMMRRMMCAEGRLQL